MKKKLATLLAVMVMTMMTVSAAETQGPVSKWLDNATSKVAKKEQSVNQKSQAKQQKLENQKKAAEHQKKVNTKKKQLKDLFTIN